MNCIKIKVFAIAFVLLTHFYLASAQSIRNTYGISDDGRFVYGQLYFPYIAQKKNLFAIRSTTGDWYKELYNVKKVAFGRDNRHLYYIHNNNLFIQYLGTKQLDSLGLASDFDLIERKNKILLYSRIKDSCITVRNMITKRYSVIKNTIKYFINPNKEIIYILTGGSPDNSISLLEFDLTQQTTRIIWKSNSQILKSLIFSDSGNCLAFTTIAKEKKYIWTYQINDEEARLMISEDSQNFSQDYKISEKVLKFSQDDSYLLFNILLKRVAPEIQYKTDIENLVSYLDYKPSSFLKADFESRINKLIALDIKNRKTVFVEKENDLIAISASNSDLLIGKDVALVYHFEKEVFSYGGKDEEQNVNMTYTLNRFNFNKYINPSLDLINLNDGSRTKVLESVTIKSNKLPPVSISTSGKILVYFDNKEGSYFALNLKTFKRTNIGYKVNTGFYNGEVIAKSSSGLINSYFDVGADNDKILWIGENAVVVSDKFGDLWRLSIIGGDPVCLTNGIGQKEKIRFSLSSNDGVLKSENEIPLNVFSDNYSTFPGCYSLVLSEAPKIKKLVGSQWGSLISYKRAENSSNYVWCISKIDMPPTIYFGKSFNQMQPVVKKIAISNPVKQEVVTWKGTNGKICAGLLLFPKNFNPSIKYPMIVNYYTHIGSRMGSNNLSYEDYSDFKSPLDLGYIFFIPDLKFEVGYTCRTVTDILVSGTKELIKRPYINEKKIGIYGGSFGGYQTNCIIGQTNLFAAALSVSGLSNLVSFSGLEDKDNSQLTYLPSIVNGQFNVGTLLWERPDLYLSNSPVFYADKVTCPVLLWHGRNDYRAPFQQAMEFYKALQANGKRVWLIAPNEGHKPANPTTISRESSKTTFIQFFGHYLKDEPAPYWMTRATGEIIEKGLNPYAYDSEINTPGDGIIPKKKIYPPEVEELLKHKTTINENGRVVDVNNQK